MGFTGHQRDSESGLHHAQFRYLDSRNGRWTRSDPAGSVDGQNLYRYVRNQPLLFLDLYGLAVTPETGWDLLSLSIGVAEFATGPTGWGAAAVLVDTVAVLTPFAPGGFGASLRASRLATEAAELIAKQQKLRLIATKAVPHLNDAYTRIKSLEEVITRVSRGGRNITLRLGDEASGFIHILKNRIVGRDPSFVGVGPKQIISGIEEALGCSANAVRGSRANSLKVSGFSETLGKVVSVVYDEITGEIITFHGGR